jgi:hypothetical protein
MQINRVRHDGGANDADGEQERLSVGNLRQNSVQCGRAPIDRRDEHLGEITKPDHGNEPADD